MDILKKARRRWSPAVCLAALSLPLFPGSATPDDGSPKSPPAQSREYQIKAAFLFNFTKFVDWPPRAFRDGSSAVSICILGHDPFEGGLDQIVGTETVNGRRVTVQRIRGDEANSCHILFVPGENGESRMPSEHLDPDVLTVGEGDGFLRLGGMIAFVIEERKVRFDVNQRATAKAAFAISSKLLRVARSVEK